MDQDILKELKAIKHSIRGGIYFLAAVIALAVAYLK